LAGLHPSDHAKVLHSVLDAAVQGRYNGSYKLLANFVNDRLLLERGRDDAADYWRYLASTRTDPRYARGMLEDAKNWVTTS
jgi:hypothetical protein